MKIKKILNYKQKIFPRETKELWKSDNNKEVMTFRNYNFCRKAFLTSPYKYLNDLVDDVMPSHFSNYFIFKNNSTI